MSRGRADAELIWGQESEGRSDEFEARRLDRAKYADPEASLLVGVGSTSPAVDARPESSELTEVADGMGSAAWRRRLSPHHRRAVGSFFSRQGDPLRRSGTVSDD